MGEEENYDNSAGDGSSSITDDVRPFSPLARLLWHPLVTVAEENKREENGNPTYVIFRQHNY